LNSPQSLEIFVAASYLGALAAPISSHMVEREITELLREIDARVIICDSRVASTIEKIRLKLSTPLPGGYVSVGAPRPGYMNDYEALVKTLPDTAVSFTTDDGPCWIAFTGGTTGKPKACIISQANLISNLLANAAQFGWTRDDRHLTAALLSHGMAFTTAIGQLLVGGTVFILESFSSRSVLDAIEKKKITWTAMVPTMLDAIINEPEKEVFDVSSLRLLVCSGGPLRFQTARKTADYFSNAGLYNSYGSTEMGWVTVLRPEDQLRKPNSVGQPMLGARVKIVDKDGHTLGSGKVGQDWKTGMPYTVSLYKDVEAEVEFRQGEWWTSGDLGKWDEDGYLCLIGRSKDVIISGGLNVYAIEVEETILGHPEITEAAVIGKPDDYWGETVHAVIVLHNSINRSVATQQRVEEELKKICEANLADYKRPKTYEFQDSLPKTPPGKVTKQALRDRYFRS
jgi:acyl-CoA synthetase (AMP-forming)/AMP-acid ligase II